MISGRCGSGTRGWQSRIWLSGILLIAVATIVFGFGSGIKPAELAANTQRTSPAFTTPGSATFGQPRIEEILGRLPLVFEENRGQSDPQVRFLARGGGYGLFLTENEAVLVLQHSPNNSSPAARTALVVRMKLAGAQTNPVVTGSARLPGRSNYFIGNDPARWQRDVPQFAAVRSSTVYPGIDLVYYGNQGRLEYDFEVAAGADPKQVGLHFDGIDRLAIDDGGDLILVSGGEDVKLKAPRVYQTLNGEERPVSARFVIRGEHEAGFEIGDYDRTRALVIDPVLTYSTYLGGTGNEACSVITGTGTPTAGCPAIAVDSVGNIYIAGATTSLDFPAPSGGTSFQKCLDDPTNPATCPTGVTASDAFVAKINSTASGSAQLIYSTYLGGAGQETTAGIAVDSGFNAILAGTTSSSNFPTVNGFQGNATGTHVFLSKLDAAAGALIYSTYLAGDGTDTATGLAVDVKDKAYVTGVTTSTNFPTTLGAFQTTPLAANQFFWSKVDVALSGTASLPYSTYYGGSAPASGMALGGGIAVDPNGNVYFTGGTNFTDFPILNAAQGCLNGPTNPATCPAQANPPHTDAFVVKFTPLTNSTNQFERTYATFIGGTGDDVGYAIAVDSAGDAFITGSTTSTDFTIPSGTVPLQSTNAGGVDVFLAKLNSFTPSTTSTTGSVALVYFSYLGGAGTDVGLSVSVDPPQTSAGARITGWTNSANFFLQNNGSVQAGFGGGVDAFVARLDTAASATTIATSDYSSYLGGSGNDAGTSVATDALGNTYVAGETLSGNFPSVNPFQSGLQGSSDAFVSRLGPSVNLAVAETVSPSPVGVGSSVSFKYTITNNGDLTPGVTFSDMIPITKVTGATATASPGSCGTVTNATLTCSLGTMNSAAVATVTVTMTPTTAGSLSDGGTVTVLGSGQVFTPAPPPAVATVNDFTLTTAPTQTSVVAGVPATYTATVTPTGNIPASVSISVSGLPSGGSSSIANNPISNLSNGPQSRPIIINTTPRTTTTTQLKQDGRIFYALWFPVSGLAFMSFGLGKKSSARRRVLAGLLLSGFFVLVLFQASCGSKGTTTTTTGTPAGTYNLVVSATSGSASRTSSVTLIVQ